MKVFFLIAAVLLFCFVLFSSESTVGIPVVLFYFLLCVMINR